MTHFDDLVRALYEADDKFANLQADILATPDERITRRTVIGAVDFLTAQDRVAGNLALPARAEAAMSAPTAKEQVTYYADYAKNLKALAKRYPERTDSMSNLRMVVSMIAGKPVDALEPHEATAAAERGELSLLDVPHLSDDAKRAVALLVPGYEMRLRQTSMGVAATWVPRSASV